MEPTIPFWTFFLGCILAINKTQHICSFLKSSFLQVGCLLRLLRRSTTDLENFCHFWPEKIIARNLCYLGWNNKHFYKVSSISSKDVGWSEGKIALTFYNTNTVLCGHQRGLQWLKKKKKSCETTSITPLVLLWCQCAVLLLGWLNVYIVIVSICGVSISSLFFLYFLVSCNMWDRMILPMQHIQSLSQLLQ